MDARKVVQQAIAGRKQFGKMYGTGPFTPEEILDALVSLSEEGDSLVVDSKEELTKARRQLTAAKAREGKLKKQIEKLKQEGQEQ